MRGTRRLDQSYVDLDTSERVRLTIAALARNDEREHSLLCQSSPKERYLGCEFAYQNGMQLADDFTNAIATSQLGPRAAKIELLDFLLWLVSNRPPKGRLKDYLALLDAERGRLLAEGAEIVHGFRAFCEQELQVDSEDMFAAFARSFIPTYRLFLGFECAPEPLDERCEDFRRVWRRCLNR